jgi:hypothetical protein
MVTPTWGCSSTGAWHSLELSGADNACARSKFDGYGEYKFKSGGAYKGEFKDGQFQGQGR